MMKCRFNRFRIGAALDAGRPLSGRLESHLAQCPECAAWCHSQLALTRRLRQAEPLAEAPPFLQARILRAIGQSRPQPEATSRMLWWAGMAAAAAVITLLAIRFPQLDQQKPLADAGINAGVPSPAGMPASTSPGFSSADKWLQAAAAIEQPLRQEVLFLKEDGLNTLRALKAGFVPNIVLTKKLETSLSPKEG